ncbi:unnamed protein product [Rhodiola kirilowii]
MSVSLVYCMYQIDDIIAIMSEGEPLLSRRKTSDAKSLVSKLPTHVAEDPMSSSGCVTETCSICMDHLGSGTMVDKVLRCGHVFHEGCLAEWLSRDLSCPLCRTTIAL